MVKQRLGILDEDLYESPLQGTGSDTAKKVCTVCPTRAHFPQLAGPAWGVNGKGGQGPV